jgi:hypothetical protein
MTESSILKAQVARDLLKKDFLDRLDSLDDSVRKLQIGAVDSRNAASAVFPGVAHVGGQPKIVADGAGNVFVGTNAVTAAGTHLSVFAKDGTYNSESIAAGDLLIGDNSASKANILWDKSAGQLKIRGGTTTEVYIDTDGTLVAGGGNVEVNSDGVTLYAASAYGTGSSRLNIDIAKTFGSGTLGYLEGYYTMNGMASAYLRMYLNQNPVAGTNPKVELVSDENLVGTYVTLSADTVNANADLSINGSIVSSDAVGCRARRTSVRSGLSWGTWYNLTPGTDTATGCFDNDGMWQSGWDYLKINTAGVYAVGMWLNAAVSNSTGVIEAKLFRDATSIASTYWGKTGWDSSTLTTVAYFTAGSKFYAKYMYGGGSGTISVNTLSAMWAVRIA